MTDREAFEAFARRELAQDAAAWRDKVDGTYVYLESEWRAWQAAIKQEREQTQALTNAAEQFVAWHKDKVGESVDPMIDYFEDIFSDALRARSEGAK